MAEAFYIPLKNRSVIRLSGGDAKKFLQGILTKNMEKLAEHQAVYALMLTPQGKFLYDFFIVQTPDALLLDCDTASLPEILKRLAMYKLRADVAFEDVSKEYEVLALPGHSEPGEIPGAAKVFQGGIAFADPRTVAMPVRAILPRSQRKSLQEAGFSERSMEEYKKLRIVCCIPDTALDMVQEKSFPLHFRMDALNAIDFDKGCYVGQEVTTRTKHLGVVRKTIFTVKGAGNVLPVPGTAIISGDKTVGELLSSIGNIGLVMLEKEAISGTLLAGDVLLELVPMA